MSNLQKRLLKLFLVERLKVIGLTVLFVLGIVIIFSLIPRMESFVFEFEGEGSTLMTFAMIFSIFLKCIPQFQLSTMAGLTRKKIIMNELLLNSINVLIAVIIFLMASALHMDWTIGSVHIYFSPEMIQFGLNSMTGIIAIFLSVFAIFNVSNRWNSCHDCNIASEFVKFLISELQFLYSKSIDWKCHSLCSDDCFIPTCNL